LDKAIIVVRLRGHPPTDRRHHERLLGKSHPRHKSAGYGLEELLNATAAQTIEKVGAACARWRATLDDVKNIFTLRTRQVTRDADSYVREKPWNPVGISAAVSILVGILLSKR
jgi:ElaB protein